MCVWERDREETKLLLTFDIISLLYGMSSMLKTINGDTFIIFKVITFNIIFVKLHFNLFRAMTEFDYNCSI